MSVSGRTAASPASSSTRSTPSSRGSSSRIAQKAGIAAPGEAADVFNLVPEYNDARRFFTLANDLTDRGWSAKRVEKILGANFVRLFGEVWG